MKEFYDAQAKFVSMHQISIIETSPMVHDSYSKHYIAEDGAEMWEHNRIVTETIYATIHGVNVKTEVKMWESECWSTDNSKSIFMYQAL